MHVKNELLWSQLDEAQFLSATDVQGILLCFHLIFAFAIAE